MIQTRPACGGIAVAAVLLTLGAGCKAATDIIVDPEGGPIDLLVGRTDAPYEDVVQAAMVVLQEEFGPLRTVSRSNGYPEGSWPRSITLETRRINLDPLGLNYDELVSHIHYGFPTGSVYLEIRRHVRRVQPFGWSIEYPFLVWPFPMFGEDWGTSPADIKLIQRIFERLKGHGWILINRIKTELQT
jgi:hypothetical protein